ISKLAVQIEVLKDKLKKERCVARQKAKAVREREKAEQAADKWRQIQARDAAKGMRLSQNCKRKEALQSSTQKNKRQKCLVGGCSEEISGTPPATPAVTIRHDRNITLYRGWLDGLLFV
ncbi:hypothetical protein T440DRAFT_410956, partial [Plenodomus tracheiphilus IPT5]